MKRLQTIFFSLLVVASAFADIHVTGKVIDADNSEPMIGVSVLVKGSTVGTITDFDGNFELTVPDKATLQLSYMGYKTVEIRAVDKMQIIMESDALQLQEVVSLGYSAVKKAADGGVIYKAKGISGDELGEQITTPPTTDKPAATIMYLYQHGGTWFNITVGHKAYFRKFKKDYGEKFIGVGINVKEMLGEVK